MCLLTLHRYQSLQNLNSLLSPAPAVISLFHEFLQMYLHVDLDMIARFAGKCGEEEAHRAYAQLQSWMRVREARLAVSHAGQIVRAGRAVPPYQVRGPDSMMIYHAIMVLWTYSMLIWDHANKTRPGTPMQESDSEGQAVYLDDDPSRHRPALNAFLFAGQGTPCLRMPSTHRPTSAYVSTSIQTTKCDLCSPSRVMRLGVKLLEGTHPGVSREDGPPLLRALCGLMEDLGKLR